MGNLKLAFITTTLDYEADSISLTFKLHAVTEIDRYTLIEQSTIYPNTTFINWQERIMHIACDHLKLLNGFSAVNMFYMCYIIIFYII